MNSRLNLVFLASPAELGVYLLEGPLWSSLCPVEPQRTAVFQLVSGVHLVVSGT